MAAQLLVPPVREPTKATLIGLAVAGVLQAPRRRPSGVGGSSTGRLSDLACARATRGTVSD
jgi:hypothetical protein